MSEVAKKPWLAHYPSDISKNICYDEKTLQNFLKETSKNHPQLKALHFLGKALTYQELYLQARKLASYLQSQGLTKGDRVSVMLPNTPQSVVAYYGILMAGGIVVQTNPLYKERELEYQVKDSGSTVIICLDQLLPVVLKVKKKTTINQIIVTQLNDCLPFPKNILYPFIQKKQGQQVYKLKQTELIHPWKNIMKKSDKGFTEPMINPKKDLALLQYTGGTTGFPKGVMLTHYNLVANVQMCKEWIYKDKQSQEVVLGVLPFFHVYGMTTVMNYSIMTGAKMVLLPKFEPEDVLKTIEKLKPSVFPGAPTIYIGLLNHPNLKDYDLTSIDVCISGSAPLPLEVQRKFQQVTKGRLIEGYGLTESSPVTHANFLDETKIQGGIGVPWPDTDAKIVSLETGEKVSPMEVGEIVVKGPQVMEGYWNKPEETNQVLQDGWLKTGDMGYMDNNGCFYVIDRKKDMIIAGGYNIYPREVEEVLYEHEAVQEAVVVGIPDPYRGETVKAFVVLKNGYDIKDDQLDMFCRKRIASYKVPRVYEFRTELPKTAVGKILRRTLIDEERAKTKTITDQTS
ncbi:long-chain-fatty-acid--CoA ligase [Aquibacillus salsiterrae]|uniref:Long-chain-fatty-acid--CoA ligase n=1 Tax=Aquibacillus salsiterrae TaxID=2950439 RepID=A0A9X3WER3_9BACI|nr:long-chain-fatty-acid--CoA ligase [Aquibacillus salsiterrae]MDC3415711.1 long-chain-fatty-acid--CoA ligase [Aquibacillus salsiterrae]